MGEQWAVYLGGDYYAGTWPTEQEAWEWVVVQQLDLHGGVTVQQITLDD